MSDYEMIIIYLTILTLLYLAEKETTSKSEPPVSFAPDRRSFAFSFPERAGEPIANGSSSVYILASSRLLVKGDCFKKGVR